MKRLNFTAMEWLVLFTIALIVAGMVFGPLMESRTYNRLTGAKTTWWDAVWVELRVQDQPTRVKD